MKKNITTIITVSALALGVSACMQHEPRASYKHPGTYESTETSTDAKGTTTVKESTTQVTVDNNGNRREVITSKFTKDPKGLMNKTGTKSRKVVQENDDSTTNY
ncbi:MAG: hypothetical protein EBR02_00090 [Alphaproteobacteria bacterium]|nr:hypothetical protein [Alphaproteobacteria bacterium]